MWWVRDPDRFHLEVAEMKALQGRVLWLKGVAWGLGSQLVPEVSLVLDVHGQEHDLKLIYPRLFPDAPAYVRPADGEQWLSGHQYGAGGSLCLEHRPDNWTREVTGAQLVQSAYDLLAAERHSEAPVVVPSAHKTTVGQDARGAANRLVLTEGSLAMLEEVPDGTSAALEGAFILHDVPEGMARVAFITKLGSPDGMLAPVADTPQYIAKAGPLWSVGYDGVVLKDEGFRAVRSLEAMDGLRSAVQAAGLSTTTVDQLTAKAVEATSQLVVLMSSDEIRAWFLRSHDEAHTFYPVHILRAASGQRLPLAASALATKKVGIVGLGSLGSKVAASLARSGVRRFYLVDGDVLLPENLIRHELSWVHVGMHKAAAMREELALIAPDVDVEVQLRDVGGQESPVNANRVLDGLGECDLIVDATADRHVFADLAAVATSRKRPICWGEVFAGGLGALLARAQPDVDPNPMAVRNAIYAFLEDCPPAPERDASRYDGSTGTALVAYDCDVARLASELTRMAIDVLVPGIESDFPHPAYLLGYRKGWIFEERFDTQPIDATGDGWEAPSDAVDQEKLTAAVEILVQGTKQRADAEHSA
jgi:molybdopterin/thiamine biosynthesis adenylyltransferase